VATTVEAPSGAPPPDKPMSARARRLSEFTPGDRVTRALLGFLALLPTAGLVFLAYQMARQAYPAIVFNGWHFFASTKFYIGNQFSSAPVEVRHGYKALPGASFGVLLMLFGTLVSSLIALIIAVPVSVGGAIFLVERLPPRLQGPLGTSLELLAGIPSVVWGLWGYLTFAPVMARDVYPYIADLHIPWFSRPIQNQDVATTSLVLAVMIIPIIASTTRELVRSVPALSKEAAVALGLTRSESVRLVTIPFIRTGIVAASILGWARALGETIAVLFISGASLSGYPHSIFQSFATLASSITNILDSALTDGTKMALHSLAEVGLVLLAITLITNFAGRLITSRLAGPGLPVGRGI
jgi:phosphate transport system permease protein